MKDNIKVSPVADIDFNEYVDSILEEDADRVRKNAAFNIRMKETRKKANITQQEMADRLGVTQQSISKIESAGHNVTVENVQSYLKELGYTLEIVPF